ncbi:Protein of unknown function (DUF732) [Mycolicibacterium rhodesiae NBB3]|jgi:hypothetical protein|uniref:DUF732 domain-containing protein n=1 Tax=Mycolicibacterium rhodesiae (strain NBB3) TaxID=710685 RepID=G8RWK5_MYCRN|nr:DUF732 domain-containing protein [Mycolicibacterium rhodesiae]AEV74313.1 Protein of unknown function (DUF732) [Mycolicibacterium rhodesiae NBB3]
MKHPLKLAGSVAVGLSAVALICAPLAVADNADDAFLGALSEQGVTWPGATPDNQIAAGKGVCQDWAAGASFEQEVNSLVPNLTAENAAFLIGAATAAYCPEYESKVS